MVHSHFRHSPEKLACPHTKPSYPIPDPPIPRSLLDVKEEGPYAPSALCVVLLGSDRLSTVEL